MNDTDLSATFGVVVEEEVRFTLFELGRACHADSGQLAALVAEGVLVPGGSDERSWQFDGTALRRARAALRLAHDFERGPAGTALVLDLLDRIQTLESRLRRAGID